MYALSGLNHFPSTISTHPNITPHSSYFVVVIIDVQQVLDIGNVGTHNTQHTRIPNQNFPLVAPC
jgi:hypothetical protein